MYIRPFFTSLNNMYADILRERDVIIIQKAIKNVGLMKYISLCLLNSAIKTRHSLPLRAHLYN